MFGTFVKFNISTKYLLRGGVSHIFNCGYGKGFSVKQVINILNKILKKRLPTSIGKRRVGEIEKVVADLSKFKKFYSWQPKFKSLRTILTNALTRIDEFLQQPIN